MLVTIGRFVAACNHSTREQNPPPMDVSLNRPRASLYHVRASGHGQGVANVSPDGEVSVGRPDDPETW